MGNVNKKMQKKCVDTVLCKDWCIIEVAAFLDFKTLITWDIAMCSDASQREKWLLSVEKVKITGVDEFRHHYNESIRWLISRRIKHVIKISICLQQKYHEKVPTRSCCGCTPGFVGSKICSKTFCGAHLLEDLKSIVLENKWDSHTSHTSNDFYYEPSTNSYESSIRKDLTNILPDFLDSIGELHKPRECRNQMRLYLRLLRRCGSYGSEPATSTLLHFYTWCGKLQPAAFIGTVGACSSAALSVTRNAESWRVRRWTGTARRRLSQTAHYHH